MPAHPATPTDRDVVDALLRALVRGEVGITYADDLTTDGLASRYLLDANIVELNPDASPDLQRRALLHALEELARPRLALVSGGRS